MRKNLETVLCVALVFLFSPALVAQAWPSIGGHEETHQTIGYLIEAISRSHLTFIRNGAGYPSEKAAEHAHAKYEHFKSQIECPEDFIRLCASRSIISGKPYLVITPQGEVTVESWLMQVLTAYRRTHEGEPVP